MKKLGKAGKEWQKARKKRIKELEATGKYVVIKTLLFGFCKDCGRYKCLDLDHIDGRGGEDPHRMENLDPICRLCHIKRHNNMANDKSKNKNSKKVNWQKPHKCRWCKTTTSMLLCHNCRRISIKK